MAEALPAGSLIKLGDSDYPTEESSGTLSSSEDILIGICVTSETIAQQPCSNVETMLGFILANISTTAQSLRGLMEIQLDTLPHSFKFLTKQGWPVAPIQEALIKIQHLINEDGVIKIQPGFDRPRVGIISKDGTALGFVFVASLTLSVHQLRQAVTSQLGGRTNTDIIFLDRNRWPICPSQESSLCILDILSGVSVYVLGATVKKRDDPQRLEVELDSSGSPPQKLHKPTPSYQSTNSLAPVNHSHSGSTFHRSRPASPLQFDQEQLAKDVVISYVRAEATQYALDLKEGLEDDGFSVYLDVHEIRCGTDWQDSLNFAVSNCEVFVPLVTPAYGQTQWTNREIKLADVLGKFIVPVNFLDAWPPGCLAIQFATTQFIAWKRPDNSNVKSKKPLTDNGTFGNFGKHSSGMRTTKLLMSSFHGKVIPGLCLTDGGEKSFSWDMEDIQYVSAQVAERFKDLRDSQAENGLTRRVTMLKSYGSILPGGVAKSSLFVTMESREGKPLVVIGVHPNQADFCDILEVWCTTELMNLDYSVPASQGLLQSSGSTLPVIYTQDMTSNDPKVLFQQKVDEAGVVLFVLSKVFAESKTCKQQVFYCEHRKRVVPLNYEHFEMPCWMSMLIGTSTFEDVQRTGYKDSLLSRVKKEFDPYSEEYNAEANKVAEFDNKVKELKCSISLKHCVYISGGTVFYYKNSEQICKAIGKSLAKEDSIDLVTGGFYGVGKVVSRTFYDQRIQQKKPPKTWHILPIRDDQDRSKQASQNEDKTFRRVNFGETLFYGDSVRERENIVSRAFNICILIEGGPGAAHEAEEFAWSEHTVIPIKCTGGAASGKFNVPQEIFKVPQGVNPDDWELLGDKNAGIDEIGDAVARIVVALQKKKDSTDISVLQASRKPSLSKMKTVILSDED
ncbi:uncharacterized protein LOC117105861 [Anneissia japonica]|uniref:uncharacterized protein LOC117105861 n=1 Tax=Anneissia japonica TaxID=1529436 RepID=UPI0014257234|nr:uncharacterized protein LOC117105861 [Anneissia japonica]